MSFRSGLPELRDDAGVVAIVVALSMSTFLLGFAAMAVDLGIAYTRKAQLQSVADRLAVATAQGLPATTGLNSDGTPGALTNLATQWNRLCSAGAEGNQIWSARVCADAGWATDGDPANGDVRFVSDTDGGLTYGLTNPPGPVLTAVRVELPPSTVQFGFAGAFGAGSTQVHKAASARIGTPLGGGILPFAVTDVDVDNGQFCVVDPATLPADRWQRRNRGAPVLTLTPSSIPFVEGAGPGGTVTVRLILTTTASRLGMIVVHTSGSSPAIPVDPADITGPVPSVIRAGQFDYSFSVELPRLDPGSSLAVWVSGEQTTSRPLRPGSPDFTTAWRYLVFAGRPAPDVDPCGFVQAQSRGFDPIARTAGGSALDQLEANVRSGPEPQLYPAAAAGSLLDPISDLCGTEAVAPSSACLTQDTTTIGFGDAVRDGLLRGGDGRPGRLIGDCGNGTMSAGGYSGIDASRLMRADSPLVDPRFGTGTALRLSVQTGGAPEEGWVTAQALRCPRMGVLPVVDDAPLLEPAGGAEIGGRAITGFVYVWIDGLATTRGLTWNGGTLRSVSGYLIKPGYLPSIVAGSPVVGPYLGPDMPKEATLICDLGDRQSGRCAR